jgi:hypothetical protein
MELGGSMGQRELCTESSCEQCGCLFTPKNRNGLKVRFCKPKCSRDWHNSQRLKGAALLKGQKPARRRGPSRHARRVSQTVFLALVPIEERAELIRQAAENLGITNRDAIEAAMRRAQVPNYEGSC